VFRHKKRPRRSGAKCTVVSLRKEGMVFRSETMRQFGGRGLVPSQQTLATRVLPQSNIRSRIKPSTSQGSHLRIRVPIEGATETLTLSPPASPAGGGVYFGSSQRKEKEDLSHKHQQMLRALILLASFYAVIGCESQLSREAKSPATAIARPATRQAQRRMSDVHGERC
jgi:hypothetical protein